MPSFRYTVSSQEKRHALLIAQGDEHAFEAFFYRYHKGLYLLAMRYFKDHAIAEDIVQDIFCKVWTHRHTLDPERSIKAFLFTTARNHILNVLRDNERVSKKIINYIKKDSDHEAVTEDSIPFHELSDKVYSAINTLPKKRRIILKLKLYKGLDNQTIAHKLNLSINTVKFQYSYALKQLRSQLMVSSLILTYRLLQTFF